MAEKEHCKFSQHGVVSLTRSNIDTPVRYWQTTRLPRSQSARQITTSIAPVPLSSSTIIPQNARIRIVRLGKLNSKGLEGSGLLTIVCFVAERAPESFGQGSGTVSADLTASTCCDVFVRVTSNLGRRGAASQAVPSAEHWLNGSTPQLGVGCLQTHAASLFRMDSCETDRTSRLIVPLPGRVGFLSGVEIRAPYWSIRISLAVVFFCYSCASS